MADVNLAVKMSGWSSLGTVRPIILHGKLADEGWRQIPNATGGYGTVSADDGSNYCHFSFTSAGVVTFENASANFIDADTDGYYCVYQSGTQVILKNCKGSEKEFLIEYHLY